MNEIVIRTRNPNDITIDETEDLARAIRAFLPNQDVGVVGKEQREGTYGVTWFQIVDIVLPLATGAGVILGKELVQEIARLGIEWARARFKSKAGIRRRPVYIPIYGPDGKIVKSVVIKNATDEPEDRTEQDRKSFG